MSTGSDDELPPPMVIADGDEALAGMFPDGVPDFPTTPLAAAYMWSNATASPVDLLTLRELSFNTEAWGDYSDIVTAMAGYGLAQNIDYSPDNDGLAYAKLFPHVEHAMQSFGEFEVAGGLWMTLLQCTDGWWRVWSVSRAPHRPAASDIFVA